MYFPSLKTLIELQLFINLLIELFFPFRRSGNHLLVGGLQQSSYTGSSCRQLESPAELNTPLFFNSSLNVLLMKVPLSCHLRSTYKMQSILVLAVSCCNTVFW